MADHSLIFQPDPALSKRAHVKSLDQYKQMYNDSINNPSSFWSKFAKEYYWKNFNEQPGCQFNFDKNKGPIFIKWWEGSKTNVCYNVLDRIVYDRNLGDRIAFYWEGNDPNDSYKTTYKELLDQVCQLANVLKGKGVKKGDRIAIYMPMAIESVVAILACARIGAIHSVIFGGFSVDSLKERLLDAQCCGMLTADGVWRGTKLIYLKEIVHKAIECCRKSGLDVKFCVTLGHLSRLHSHLSLAKKKGDVEDGCNRTHKEGEYVARTPWDPSIDSWWDIEMAGASKVCEPEWMDAEDPLFMLYTSGSTGKPKGVLHTCGGYMTYVGTTFKYIFDHHDDDVYWCTADIGWITGHSYVVYGPMANGATSVFFEGIPFHPHPGRYWEIIEKYRVNKFYTSPTAIRSLMRFGEEHLSKYDRSSLEILGSVGEPINPEAWLWFHKKVGEGRCPIVDTYWQTETGGITITPLPGAMSLKPGSASLPFFGIKPTIFDDDGHEVTGEGDGNLAFSAPWPGIMRTVYGNHQKFEDTYFKRFPGHYVTGDGAHRDLDDYLWVTGRIDDMLNVSGHLLSTAQIEGVLVAHHSVAEAAAVARPHAVKGECLHCFVSLKENQSFTPELLQELKLLIRQEIGPFAVPDFIQQAQVLPKTRSGKIVRRILRKVARNDKDVGDLSTLVDPSIIDDLFKNRV